MVYDALFRSSQIVQFYFLCACTGVLLAVSRQLRRVFNPLYQEFLFSLSCCPCNPERTITALITRVKVLLCFCPSLWDRCHLVMLLMNPHGYLHLTDRHSIFSSNIAGSLGRYICRNYVMANPLAAVWGVNTDSFVCWYWLLSNTRSWSLGIAKHSFYCAH